MNKQLNKRKMILEELKQLLTQQLSITIDGETYPVCIIDWAEIVAEHDKVLEENSGKSNEEMDHFWAHTTTKMQSIYDYFLYDEIIEMKVDDKEILPIGLLGLDASAHNHGFAEMNNDGFIAIDLTKGKLEEAPIYFIEEYDMLEIAKNITEFKQKLIFN